MTGTLLTILLLALLAVACGWLASRAWRARRGWVKWPGTILAGLLTVLLAAVTLLGVIGVFRLEVGRSGVAAANQVAVQPENTERVARWVNGCAGCHSSGGNLPLDGSKDNFLEGSPMGVLYAPNLTPGGPTGTWSDSQIVRAVREGIDKDGRALVIMPSQGFRNLSDADAQAMVTYLRGQPAVAHNVPARSLTILPALLVGAGMFPTSAQPAITQPVVAPHAGITPEYGKYLVSFSGCSDCHGADLKGGKPGGFGPPAGPNLAGIVPRWSDTDFVKLIRTGTDPTGRQINSDAMPWKDFGKMFTDDELKAIYVYLHGLSS